MLRGRLKYKLVMTTRKFQKIKLEMTISGSKKLGKEMLSSNVLMKVSVFVNAVFVKNQPNLCYKDHNQKLGLSTPFFILSMVFKSL